MSFLTNPMIWLFILIVFATLSMMVYSIVKYCKKEAVELKGTVLGNTVQVTNDVILQHIMNPPLNDSRLIVIVDKEEYSGCRGQMIRASKLSNCLSKSSNCSNLYEKIFKPNIDKNAKKHDLGGIIMSIRKNDNIEIYFLTATSIGEKFSIYEKSYPFWNVNEISNDINNFYNNIKNKMSEAIVIAVNPEQSESRFESNKDFTFIDGVTELDDDDENFGMYTGALDSWLYSHSHPSASNVNRYTKKNVLIQNAHSINNAVPQDQITDSIPIDAYNRFQTPMQYATEK